MTETKTDKPKPLLICPKCGRKFKSAEWATKHAEKRKHWGDYSVY